MRPMNKRRSWLLVLLLLSPVVAQLQQSGPNGTIYGVVVTLNGEPARNLRLTARPLLATGGHSGDFPHTRTNQAGEYRFQKLPLAAYIVYADDEAAGYSRVSTGPLGASVSEVEITTVHPETEFNFSLPPKAGFIRIHLTNRRTRAPISDMTVSVLPLDKADSGLFTLSGGSAQLILVPPDRNLLLRVTAEGFREWEESIGTGRPVNVASGSRLMLDVRLDPLD
jgi:hypothetical protein